MKTNTSIQCVTGLLALLLAWPTAQARDAVLVIQGYVMAPSCDAQALSTAMAAGQAVLNGQDCGLAVRTGLAANLTVAKVREVQVSAGPNADAVKTMVILTYH
jgi:hypothetical protein